jgi:hypothetical protein
MKMFLNVDQINYEIVFFFEVFNPVTLNNIQHQFVNILTSKIHWTVYHI